MVPIQRERRTVKKKQALRLSPDQVLKSRLANDGKVKVVEIHFMDPLAVGGDQWVTQEDLPENAASSVAVGYLVQENEKTYTLLGVSNENHYAHGITVPKGCIIQFVILG